MECRVSLLLAVVGSVAVAGCASDRAPDPVRSGEGRAIQFLRREVPAWFRDHGCFSCHNNGDAARALYAASAKGYRIPEEILSDTTGWVTHPGRWEDNKGDPGFSDQRLANIQFAASLVAAVTSGRVMGARSVVEAAKEVAADQGPDGSWPVEPQNRVGSPATYGTALATYMAWRVLTEAKLPALSDQIARADEWLSRLRPDSVYSASVLLLSATRSGRPFDPGRVEECLSIIGRGQGSTGGWGPYADSPSEPFDTALVLLALAELRSWDRVEEWIRRGRAFLLAEQRPDGSWDATTRPPGGASYAQQMSTTGWAVLGLLATGTRTESRL